MSKKSFDVQLIYEQDYLPTARCRIERHRTIRENTRVGIQVLDGDRFPVAMTVRDRAVDGERFVSVSTDLRMYGGRLFSRARYPGLHTGKVMTEDAMTFELGLVSAYRAEYDDGAFTDASVPVRDDRSAREKVLAEAAERYVLFRGEVWKECGEPMYEVDVFGLGHNHGGTSMFVVYEYNTNIPASRYFRADEREKAVAEAVRIAVARGDTESVGRIRREDPAILVRMPEAVRRDPAKDHGNGDPFLNAVEDVTETAGSVAEAGVLTMALAASVR